MAILLNVESIEQIGLTTIRVHFSLDPLTASTTGQHDALNPANYALSPPSTNSVDSVEVVSGDPKAVDLQLTEVLTAGPWTVTVSNVKMFDGTLLGITSASLMAVELLNQEPVSQGAKSTTAEETLRDMLNPALQGPAWDALVAALATGDQYLWDLAEAAFDQLFKVSARGKYLDKRMSDDGIARPLNVGISDGLFSKYGISVSSEKLTQIAILKVLEVFYGQDAVRANSISGTYAPFALVTGDDLWITIDGKFDYVVSFDGNDFVTVGAATALEVALAITRSLRKQGDIESFALPFVDAAGNSYVKIYSGSLGLGGSVRVNGGKAQNVLQFSSIINTYHLAGGLPVWTITKNAAQGTIRFTVSAATSLDLFLVSDRDYVTIYGREFITANQGSFPIVATSVTYPGNNTASPRIQWFEIENFDGVAEPPITQLFVNSVLFFSPDLKTIHVDYHRTVVVSQGEGTLRILLPATTQAVNRAPLLAAYPSCPTPLSVTSLVRSPSGLVTCTTSTPHGLFSGGQVIVDGATCDLVPPSIHVGNPASNPALADSRILSVVSDLKATAGAGLLDFGLAKMNNGGIIFVGGISSLGPTVYRNDAEIYVPYGTNALSDGSVQVKYNYQVAAVYPLSVQGLRCVNLPAQNKVLAFGGFDGANYTNNSYLYDPVGDSWTGTGNLIDARMESAFSALANGDILITGGLTTGGVTLATTEKFTGAAWVAQGAMADSRELHTQTTLTNGTVLVTGGTNGAGNQVNTCEIYSAGTWSLTGPMTFARVDHMAFLLSDGRVLVAGGSGYDPTQSITLMGLKDAEIYDSVSKRWSFCGRMSQVHNDAFGWYDTINEKVYVGGASYYFVDPEPMDIYDVRTGKWSTTFACPRASLPWNTYFSRRAIQIDATSALLIGGKDNFGPFALSNIHQIFVPGCEMFMDGGLNGIFEVKGVSSPTKFTYQSQKRSYSMSTGTGMTVTPFAAASSPVGAPGPYVFEPTKGSSITAIETTLTQALPKGQYNSINVADATIFPDEPGFLCFAFATKDATYPVRYLGRLSNTSLRLDFGFKFQKDIPIGSKVTLLSSLSVPLHPEDVGAFYLTASPAGRVAASVAIDSIVPAGYDVDKEVIYPGDRGLAGEGLPQASVPRVADKVNVWAGDEPDAEVEKARED